jgi:hypothetical protein
VKPVKNGISFTTPWKSSRSLLSFATYCKSKTFYIATSCLDVNNFLPITAAAAFVVVATTVLFFFLSITMCMVEVLLLYSHLLSRMLTLSLARSLTALWLQVIRRNSILSILDWISRRGCAFCLINNNNNEPYWRQKIISLNFPTFFPSEVASSSFANT